MSKEIDGIETVIFDEQRFHAHGATGVEARRTFRNFKDIPDSEFVEHVQIVPTDKGSEQLLRSESTFIDGINIRYFYVEC